MATKLAIDSRLLERALAVSGERTKTAAVTRALEEYVARHFSGATVVKAFNHIPSDDITAQAEPSGTENRRALAVYSDDENAKGLVSSLIDEIGFDPYDGGTLADSWRIQRDTPAYGPRFTAAELEAKLAEAKRYRDM